MDRSAANRAVIEAFRAGRDPEGMHRDRLLLLTTTGRRTGQARTTPMMFHRDGNRPMVVASNAGAVLDPQWFRNLLSHSQVLVEVGEERYPAVARALTGAEYDAAWADITARLPFFLDHQAGVQRRIPVVELARRTTARPPGHPFGRPPPPNNARTEPHGELPTCRRQVTKAAHPRRPCRPQGPAPSAVISAATLPPGQLA